MTAAPRLRNILAASVLVAMSASAAAQQKLREVTVALSSASLGAASPRVAKELGLFEKHGLSAKVVPMDSANTSLAALISKSADAALASSGTVINATLRGQKIVAVANLYGGFATTMVVSNAAAAKMGVRTDAPPEQRLKAADGLTIATPEAAAGSTLGFKAAMASVDGAFRFTYMPQQSMQAALENGAIDGYLASAPFWAGPVANGKGVVWISGPKNELPAKAVNGTSTQLQMLRSTVESDPDLVNRLVAVFNDFKKAIVERPAEVRAATQRVFPDLDPKVLDVVYPNESAAWNGKVLTRDDMIREIEFIKRSGGQFPGIDGVDPGSLIWP